MPQHNHPWTNLVSQTIADVNTVGNDVLLDTYDATSGSTTPTSWLKRPASESYIYHKGGVLSGFGPYIVAESTGATVYNGHNYFTLKVPFAYTESRSLDAQNAAAKAADVAPPAPVVLSLIGVSSCGFSVMDKHKLIVAVGI